MDIAIYHPQTQAVINVPEESVWHYRQSGWITYAEWQENEALRAAAETAQAVKTVKTPVAGSREK